MEIKRLGLSATRNFDKGGADESRPFFSATRHLRLARRAACSLLSETPATTSTWIGDPAPRMAPLCHFPTTNGLYPLSWPGRRFRASPSFSLVTCTLVRRPFFGSGVGVLGPHQWGVDHHRQAISVRRANAYSAYLGLRVQKAVFRFVKARRREDRVEDHATRSTFHRLTAVNSARGAENVFEPSS